MLWNAAWKHNDVRTALDDSSAWRSQILWHFVLSAHWEWILMHSSLQPCLSTISEKANWQRPQLYQRHPAAQVPDSPGAVLASLPSSITVPQWPKGFAPYHPLGNVQWNSSPAFQYLGDSLLPRWALRPTQVHPRAPGAKPSWTRALPSAWQRFLQLQSSLEQRQTPGQPGNRNKLCWVITSRLVPSRCSGFAKSLPDSLLLPQHNDDGWWRGWSQSSLSTDVNRLHRSSAVTLS